jgi:nucleotide-binding universal stress UspA family protein
MMIVLIIVIAVLAIALVAALTFVCQSRRQARRPASGDTAAKSKQAAASGDRGSLPAGSCRRILFPFVASALSSKALDAALRLARAEDATLVPVFLARVPMHLPLGAPLPKQSEIAIALQEAIEQRAARVDVPIDARIERGRDNRHALREAIAAERYDRVVIAAAVRGCPGFGADDVAWLLDNAPGEIIVLRTADPNQMIRPRTLTEARAAPVSMPPTTTTGPLTHAMAR